jgi:hypothetical protein
MRIQFRHRFLSGVLLALTIGCSSILILGLSIRWIGYLVNTFNSKDFSTSDLFLLLFETFIVSGFVKSLVLSIQRRYCPTCDRHFMLKKYSPRIIVQPDYGYSGKQQIIYRCSRCSYEKVYEEVIPAIPYQADDDYPYN